MDSRSEEFEYDQVMRSYHEYFQIAAKGITIYLLLIGACLTLPNTLQFDSPDRVVILRAGCRLFVVVVSIAALATYLVASKGFWILHQRAKALAAELQLASPTTWILPFSVWVASGAAVVLLRFLWQYM